MNKNQTYTKETETDAKELKRYSDAELEEFKEIILLKLRKVEKDLSILKKDIKNENGTEDTGPIKCLEEGSRCFSVEENGKSVQRLEKFKVNLENALIRIQNKTYGVCRVTGKLIPKGRLKSVPHATLSIEAKEALTLNGKKIKINGNGIRR